MSNRAAKYVEIVAAGLCALAGGLSTAVMAEPAGGALVDPAGPVESGDVAPQVTQVIPARITVSNKPQRIIIKGRGFTKGCRVALSRNGQIEVWPESEVEYLSEGELALRVITGEKAANWSVMVGNRKNQTSNMYGFKVYEVTGRKGEALAATKPTVPEPPKTVVPRPAAMSSNSVEKRSGSGGLQGADWYRAQPRSHYTLQLLASNSSMNLRTFVRKHPQLDPMASFMMRRGGELLYVLTTGSYPNREAALKAAERLPEGLKAWPRAFTDVLTVMEQEPAEVQPAAISGELQKKDTAWVWSRDPQHYTVQLAGAESEKAITEAMRQTGLGGEMSVVRTERNGKSWYVLIYGSYTDREEAKRSIERLPGELQRTSPWPRSFASLQDELSRPPGRP